MSGSDDKGEGTSGSQVQGSSLRSRILQYHLLEVATRHPASTASVFSSLTFGSLLSTFDIDEQKFEDHDDDTSEISDARIAKSLPGGISENDLKRFGPRSMQLDAVVRAQLTAELKRTLLNLSGILYREVQGVNEEQRLAQAMNLPDEIQLQKEKAEFHRGEVQSLHERIQILVQEINEIHPRLEGKLSEARETLPPLLDAERTARFDLLAITIETCLLKLSLIRSRTHAALYGSKPDLQADMNRALANAHERLLRNERKQAEEEQLLDTRIAEYQNLIRVVDGQSGAFSQIVEDMAKVRKEMNECKHDLRRLGWTGD